MPSSLERPDAAIGAALKVYETHRRVRGSLPDSLDVAAEPSYSANDPELLM